MVSFLSKHYQQADSVIIWGHFFPLFSCVMHSRYYYKLNGVQCPSQVFFICIKMLLTISEVVEYERFFGMPPPQSLVFMASSKEPHEFHFKMQSVWQGKSLVRLPTVVSSLSDQIRVKTSTSHIEWTLKSGINFPRL